MRARYSCKRRRWAVDCAILESGWVGRPSECDGIGGCVDGGSAQGRVCAVNLGECRFLARPLVVTCRERQQAVEWKFATRFQQSVAYVVNVVVVDASLAVLYVTYIWRFSWRWRGARRGHDWRLELGRNASPQHFVGSAREHVGCWMAAR